MDEPDKVDKHVANDYKHDELKLMLLKDTEPPHEIGGARKDFMPWHESFTSMLRLRKAKSAKVVHWLKAEREKRLVDGKAKAEYLAYSWPTGQMSISKIISTSSRSTSIVTS